MLLPVVLGLLVGSAAGSDLGEFLGRRVTSIEVTIDGVPGSNAGEMKSLLTLSVGQDYSPVAIRESLEILHRSGLIAGARVEATSVGSDGVAIKFLVKPQARIDNVVFQGETIVSAADLRARLNELDPGQRLSENAVTQGAGELVAFYSARGYYKAHVDSEIQLDPSGTRASVIYKVTTGEQARVSRYTRDIKGAHRAWRGQAGNRRGTAFSQAAVGEEMERIRQAYIKQDYLGVRVSNNIAADLIENSVAVTLSVESGPRIMVEVEGLEMDEKARKKTLTFYALGGIDDFTLEEGRRRLSDYAQQRGYFFAEVTRPDQPPASRPMSRI
jgi:outer membrane protein assembly factor BamA